MLLEWLKLWAWASYRANANAKAGDRDMGRARLRGKVLLFHQPLRIPWAETEVWVRVRAKVRPWYEAWRPAPVCSQPS